MGDQKLLGPNVVQEDLSYMEEPVRLLDRKEKQLRTKIIPLVKVLWRSEKIEEATENQKSKYESLIHNYSKVR